MAPESPLLFQMLHHFTFLAGHTSDLHEHVSPQSQPRAFAVILEASPPLLNSSCMRHRHKNLIEFILMKLTPVFSDKKIATRNKESRSKYLEVVKLDNILRT